MSSQSGRPRWSAPPAARAVSEPRAMEEVEEIPEPIAAVSTPAPISGAASPRLRPSAGDLGRQDLRQELEATVQTRQELGPGYDEPLIEAFLERLDRSLDERIAARLAVIPGPERATRPGFTKGMIGGLAVSLALGIPLTAIGAEKAGTPGLLAIWLAIAVIWLGILGYLPRPKG